MDRGRPSFLRQGEGVPDERRREEFEATALPLARPLYATALRMTGRAEDALDVVQETFLRAFRTFDNFTAGTNPRAWLFAILRSVSANRWRRERRQPLMVPLEDWEERFGALAAGGAPVHDATSEEVSRALAALPEDFRLVLLLVDVEGLTYEEAASAVGCPVGTIRSRLSRARRALFVALRDYAREAGYARATP
jgi:RNA polymerase sigma-70 factor (ECF subfamily)